jgi:chromate transporter
MHETGAISFATAFRFWLKLGFISFGGPAGQIALMHDELVERRRWISEGRFLHALNYCMVLPGPEAQQLATYLGWLMHRTAGGLVAGTLFVLPSLFILILLSWIYMRFGQMPAVAGVLYGMRPAVTAIVLFAAVRIGSKTLKHPALWAIAAAAFITIAWLHVPFPAIILGAAALGAAGGRYAPAVFARAPAHGAMTDDPAAALIHDHAPPPAHARPRRAHIVLLVTTFLFTWAGALAATATLSRTLAQMGWFFTKAALLTFGGAYAVLPYVFQGSVEHHGWLTASQMIDGLALGETTPGPLIMVVAFVGYVGGWTHAVLGPDALAAGGILGAAVVTFFTFLPSFLFVLVGAPLIEATRGNVGLAAPLTAVTAAVVGVILNLAVFFAAHVFWPDELGGPVDFAAIGIAAAAVLALARRVSVVALIAACGLLGLAFRWMSGAFGPP